MARLGSSVRACLYAALALSVLHLGAREAVAAAVAFAPNARPFRDLGRVTALPPALRARGAERFQATVGSPAATLVSWLVEPFAPERAKGTIVLLHGVRMDKRSLVPVATALSDAGYRALLVDLRGHGESSGRYLSYGPVEARDISALLDALAAHGERLGCVGAYGFSYGGAVSLMLAARDERVRAVVAVSAFSSLREVVSDYRHKYLPRPLALIPDAWFQGAVDEAGRIGQFDPDDAAPVRAVARSRAGVLLIHGSADTQVPPRHSRELLHAAGARARLLTIRGAEHDTMPADPAHIERSAAVAWFDQRFSEAGCWR